MGRQSEFDYSRLPDELRLYALGLDVRPVGRPRILSFRERFMIAAHWANIANSLARPGQTTKRPGLEPILKQIARARKRGLPEWRIMALSREADRVGRFHSTPILPPAETKPEIDKIVAKDLGLTSRQVRSIRTDKQLAEFVPPPLWEPRDWEQEIAREGLKFLREALWFGDVDPRQVVPILRRLLDLI